MYVCIYIYTYIYNIKLYYIRIQDSHESSIYLNQLHISHLFTHWDSMAFFLFGFVPQTHDPSASGCYHTSPGSCQPRLNSS